MSFSIGDRVRVTSRDLIITYGLIGRIAQVKGHSYLVDFAGTAFRSGHDGGGVGNKIASRAVLEFGSVTGWYLSSSYLELVDRASAAQISAPKPFYLIEIVRNEIVEIAGEEFDDGAMAAARAADLTRARGHKVQARRRKTNANWHQVEADRLASGSVSPLDVEKFGLPRIAEHYAYLTEGNRVSYVPSEEYGAVGRRSELSPGSYLTRFYSALSQSQVETYEALLRYSGKLQFTADPKEAVRIYRRGPESCMSTGFSSLAHHPVEAYFAGDLSLAYLEDDGRIIARCLVWPERKLYTRAYGDLAKIKALLRRDGYSHGDFVGARMQRLIHEEDRSDWFILPYIDKSDSYQGSPAALRVVDEKDHLRITDQWKGYHCGHTSALKHLKDWVDEDDAPFESGDCQRCGDEYGADDLETVVVSVNGATEQWCELCREEHGFHCYGERRRFSNSVPRGTDGNGRAVSLYHLNRIGGFICASTGQAHVDEQPVVLANGATWSRDAFLKGGVTCAGNGRNYALSDSELIGAKRYSADYLHRFGRPKEDAPPAANQDFVHERERLRA